MKYWIRINRADHGPYSEAEIRQHFGECLPSNTPCAQVGVNEWGTLGELLPKTGSGAPQNGYSITPTLSPTEAQFVEIITKKVILYYWGTVLLLIMLPFLIVINCTEYKKSGMIGLALCVTAIVLLPGRFDKISKANPELSWGQVLLRSTYLVRPKRVNSNPFTSDFKQ